MHHFLFPILSISTEKHVLGGQRQSPLSRTVVRFSNLGGLAGVEQIAYFSFCSLFQNSQFPNYLTSPALPLTSALVSFRAIRRSENLKGQVVMWWDNLPPHLEYRVKSQYKE